jgi:ABC-type histidine transport system ATPase subunit
MAKRDTAIKDNSTESIDFDLVYNNVSVLGASGDVLEITSDTVSGSFETLKQLNLLEQDLKDCLFVIEYIKKNYTF